MDDGHGDPGMIGWPAALKPNGGGFGQLVRSLSGGPSLSGFEQIVPQMTDRWQARYQVPVRSRDQMLAMRAMLGQLRGRSGTIALPAYENRYAPWRTDQYGRRFTPKYVRTRALDGSLYADAANINDTLITVTVLTPAAAGAVEVNLRFSSAGRPQLGNRFSINARLYEIIDLLHYGGDEAGGTDWRATIWPWLRFAAAASAVVDFATPVCEMRLASDDQGQDAMQSLDVMKYATPVLQFEEAAPMTDELPPGG
jgi:hypothetical protein